MTFPHPLVVCGLITAVFSASCVEGSSGTEPDEPCGRFAHYGGTECFCDEGYDWCNDVDFDCCTAGELSRMSEPCGRHSYQLNGECHCAWGYDWCSDDPSDFDCCNTDDMRRDDPPAPDDVVEGSVRIESLSGIIVDGMFLTYIAHLLGGQIGDQSFGFINDLRLTNDSDREETVLVGSGLQGYSTPVTEQVRIGPGETLTIPELTPAFDFPLLYSVTSAVTANAYVAVEVGGDVVDLATDSVRIQPINRVRWFFEEEDGTVSDWRPMVVTLVTPEDRAGRVQTLITEAAEFSEYGAIFGYQRGTEAAYDQARAIYRALQDRGMVYTSVSGSFFDDAQHVKLPAESLTTNSANCIDATLLFASAYEAMGMEPVLVFLSGHALVGVRMSPGGEWIAIETTLISTATFDQAVDSALERATNAADSDPLYLRVDVKTLRERGFAPINM